MENIFTEVKNRLSIKDVIEHYSLATFNRDNKCYCPFPDHQDVKSPSLSILKDNNTFRCFGCDKSGSVIDFVMMYKGVDKVKAVQMLNEDFNLGLNFKEQSKKKIDIKKYLLTCEKDIDQTDYFIKRGLLPTTIKKHRLGYDKVKKAVTFPYNGKT